MMKKIIAVAAFLLCTTAAQAGIVMGGTRVIYQEGKREAAISVTGNDSNLLIVFYVQIMPDDFVMQLHRF
ncbi:hypothetical protein SN02_03106 [Klebsiella pneumoniae]|nr:hypothetical protein SN02_03106 [Klebsiella pneumoniae]